MSMPVSFIPAEPRRHRRRSELAVSNTPVLVLATYDPKTSVTLGFDREIDISEMDGSQITVSDGAFTGETYAATGIVTVINPTTVRIRLNFVAAYPGAGIVLNATSANGIVASGGTAWGGVSNLQLPYAP